MTVLQRADWVGATARRCAMETVHGPHDWTPWLWKIADRSDRDEIVAMAVRLSGLSGPSAPLPDLSRIDAHLPTAADVRGILRPDWEPEENTDG